MKIFQIFIVIVASIIILSLVLNLPSRQEKQQLLSRVDQLEKQLKESKNVSPLLEIQPDYSNMPSYCKPKSYTIVKVNSRYYVKLPGGTIGDNYPTIEEAQKDINERAAQSKKVWLDSGGLDF